MLERVSFNVAEVISRGSFLGKQTGLFAGLLRVLRHPRRPSGKRTLWRPHASIDSAGRKVCPGRMYVSEETRAPAKPAPSTPAPLSAPIQWSLIAFILLMFLALQVLAGSILQRAETASAASSHQRATSQANK